MTNDTNSDTDSTDEQSGESMTGAMRIGPSGAKEADSSDDTADGDGADEQGGLWSAFRSPFSPVPADAEPVEQATGAEQGEQATISKKLSAQVITVLKSQIELESKQSEVIDKQSSLIKQQGERIEALEARVERMESAQGVSQQSRDAARPETGGKLWGKNSPFAPGQGL